MCFLMGCGASRGRISGKAVVLKSEDNFSELENLQEKVILVAPYTTPTYTPYFSKIKGIITEYGGLGAHAAIIARELDIPCITDVPYATFFLKTGDEITLDADKGLIIVGADSVFRHISQQLVAASQRIGAKKKWPADLPSPLFISFAREISKLFGTKASEQIFMDVSNPSLLWKALSFAIFGTRYSPAEWPRNKREQLTSEIYATIKHAEQKQAESAQRLLRRAIELPPTKDLELAKRFKAVLWLYAESIYFASHDAAVSICGPYEYAGKKFLIYECKGLKNPDLWPNVCFKELPNEITFVVQYPKEAIISLDVFGNVYGETVGAPEKIWIVENLPRTIEDYLVIFQKVAEKTAREITQMDEHAKIQKQIESFQHIFGLPGLTLCKSPLEISIGPAPCFFDVSSDLIHVKAASTEDIKNIDYPKKQKSLVVAEFLGSLIAYSFPQSKDSNDIKLKFLKKEDENTRLKEILSAEMRNMWHRINSE